MKKYSSLTFSQENSGREGKKLLNNSPDLQSIIRSRDLNKLQELASGLQKMYLTNALFMQLSTQEKLKMLQVYQYSLMYSNLVVSSFTQASAQLNQIITQKQQRIQKLKGSAAEMKRTFTKNHAKYNALKLPASQNKNRTMPTKESYKKEKSKGQSQNSSMANTFNPRKDDIKQKGQKSNQDNYPTNLGLKVNKFEEIMSTEGAFHRLIALLSHNEEKKRLILQSEHIRRRQQEIDRARLQQELNRIIFEQERRRQQQIKNLKVQQELKRSSEINRIRQQQELRRQQQIMKLKLEQELCKKQGIKKARHQVEERMKQQQNRIRAEQELARQVKQEKEKNRVLQLELERTSKELDELKKKEQFQKRQQIDERGANKSFRLKQDDQSFQSSLSDIYLNPESHLKNSIYPGKKQGNHPQLQSKGFGFRPKVNKKGRSMVLKNSDSQIADSLSEKSISAQISTSHYPGKAKGKEIKLHQSFKPRIKTGSRIPQSSQVFESLYNFYILSNGAFILKDMKLQPRDSMYLPQASIKLGKKPLNASITYINSMNQLQLSQGSIKKAKNCSLRWSKKEQEKCNKRLEEKHGIIKKTKDSFVIGDWQENGIKEAAAPEDSFLRIKSSKISDKKKEDIKKYWNQKKNSEYKFNVSVIKEEINKYIVHNKRQDWKQIYDIFTNFTEEKLMAPQKANNDLIIDQNMSDIDVQKKKDIFRQIQLSQNLLKSMESVSQDENQEQILSDASRIKKNKDKSKKVSFQSEYSQSEIDLSSRRDNRNIKKKNIEKKSNFKIFEQKNYLNNRKNDSDDSF